MRGRERWWNILFNESKLFWNFLPALHGPLVMSEIMSWYRFQLWRAITPLLYILYICLNFSCRPMWECEKDEVNVRMWERWGECTLVLPLPLFLSTRPDLSLRLILVPVPTNISSVGDQNPIFLHIFGLVCFLLLGRLLNGCPGQWEVFNLQSGEILATF